MHRPATLPDVTVVLLVYQPGEREVQTAKIVRKQRYDGVVLVQVIDSSPDKSLPANLELRRAADTWVSITPDSFGHGRTRNLGVQHCFTPLVAFLSQDAHPVDDDWLRALVQPLVDGRAEASYGKQQPPESNPEREATYGFLYPEVGEIRTMENVAREGLRTFHFSDVSSAFPTNVIRRVRFPEEIHTFEDVGIAKRLLDGDCRIAYVPEAAVWHAHILSKRAMFARYREIGMIYERLGIFGELRRAGRSPFLGEGVRVAKAVSPRGKAGLKEKATPVLVGALKASAVTWGHWEERLGKSTGRRLGNLFCWFTH